MSNWYSQVSRALVSQGPTLELMKEVAKEWRQHDWKKTQDKYNTSVITRPTLRHRSRTDRPHSFNHFKVDIEGLDIHFLHHKSERQDALPILLAHGWPGGSTGTFDLTSDPSSPLLPTLATLTGHFGEFLDMIPLLTSPPSQTQQAFHVVVPSQPGFAFSSPAKTHSHTMDDTARIFDKLMTGLGYERYAAQGGDWGAVTVRCLGALYPQRCKGVCDGGAVTLMCWQWCWQLLLARRLLRGRLRYQADAMRSFKQPCISIFAPPQTEDHPSQAGSTLARYSHGCPASSCPTWIANDSKGRYSTRSKGALITLFKI